MPSALPGPLDMHARASDELARQANYYGRRGGPLLARRFIDDFEHTWSRIVEAPRLVKPWKPAAADLGVRRLLFQHFPFAIVYLIDPPNPPGHPWIVAVAHGKRRPMYWVRRLPSR